MKKISEFIGKYMALIVLAIAALALFWPGTCLWIQTKWINYLLMVVMFGMGLTMKLADFTVVFKQPRDVITGCAAQFVIMPLLAFGLGKVFGLSDELLVGVVLVGTCPGGTSSNVITYLSTAPQKGGRDRDRNAEFRSCDLPRRLRLPESGHGNSPGGDLLRVAQYFRRDPRRNPEESYELKGVL